MMVQLEQPIRPYGSDWHQPVILPLPREKGDRCSVKPASRSALHFRRQANQAFAWLEWLTLGLERAGQ